MPQCMLPAQAVFRSPTLSERAWRWRKSEDTELLLPVLSLYQCYAGTTKTCRNVGQPSLCGSRIALSCFLIPLPQWRMWSSSVAFCRFLLLRGVQTGQQVHEAVVAIILSSRHCPTSEMVKASMNMITCVFYCKNELKHSDSKFLEICKVVAYRPVFLFLVFPFSMWVPSPLHFKIWSKSLAALSWFEVS